MSEYKHTDGDAKNRLQQWIHLCEQSNATGEATEIMDAAIARIEALEAQLAKMDGLLRAAACPQNCDSGAIPYQTGMGEWECYQCQFCYKREQMLGTPPEGEG